jgi:protein-S-isoprenylcysteine O-methyltransferase Ste14
MHMMVPVRLIPSLRLLSWIVCGIYATIPAYWLLVHPFANRWRRVRYNLELLAILWILLWCLAWAASYPWRLTALYQGAEGWAVAPYLWIFSLIMYYRASRGFTLARIIGWYELRPKAVPGSLVTDGVHAIVRHPLYLGHLCTITAFALCAGTVACAGLYVFAVVMGAIMIVFEERELRSRFGTEWDAYCERTPALIPMPKL